MDTQTMIYLAGPVDDISLEDAKGWREELGQQAPSGVLFYSPVHAYVGTVTKATIQMAERINRTFIHACQGMIANMSGPGRGFGTIREIEFARLSGVPVVAIVNEPLDSLLAYDVYMAMDVDDALTTILEAANDIRQQQNRHPLFGLLGLDPPGSQQ